MVYGLWFMGYGLWFMVYGLWFMVYGLWFMVYCSSTAPSANVLDEGQKIDDALLQHSV